eukprot:22191-Prorocentrum_minimum.AAC.1
MKLKEVDISAGGGSSGGGSGGGSGRGSPAAGGWDDGKRVDELQQAVEFPKVSPSSLSRRECEFSVRAP